ncbi:MAG: hypothetical protein Q7T41_01015 [Candidatus Saccharibacteria bacterium]|nr:hypothetical protein [Candidatus Saccharibacteria bacterium]
MATDFSENLQTNLGPAVIAGDIGQTEAVLIAPTPNRISRGVRMLGVGFGAVIATVGLSLVSSGTEEAVAEIVTADTICVGISPNGSCIPREAPPPVDWKDVLGRYGCADGKGHPEWDPIVGTEEGKRLDDVVDLCPPEVGLSILDNTYQDGTKIGFTQEQYSRYAELIWNSSTTTIITEAPTTTKKATITTKTTTLESTTTSLITGGEGGQSGEADDNEGQNSPDSFPWKVPVGVAVALALGVAVVLARRSHDQSATDLAA